MSTEFSIANLTMLLFGFDLPSLWQSSYCFCLMMMMMNCFHGMVNRRKEFSLHSSRDHCQRSSLSRISNTPPEGFEPVENLSSGLVEWSHTAVITCICQFKMSITLSSRHSSKTQVGIPWILTLFYQLYCSKLFSDIFTNINIYSSSFPKPSIIESVMLIILSLTTAVMFHCNFCSELLRLW